MGIGGYEPFATASRLEVCIWFFSSCYDFLWSFGRQMPSTTLVPHIMFCQPMRAPPGNIKVHKNWPLQEAHNDRFRQIKAQFRARLRLQGFCLRDVPVAMHSTLYTLLPRVGTVLAPNKPALRHENVAGCADHHLSKPARTRTWVKGLGVGCLNIAAPFDP